MFVGYNIVVLATRFLLGRIIEHVGKKKTLIIAVLNSICMVTLLSLGNPTIFIISFSLLGISLGLVYPTGAMLLAEAVDQTNLNLANSLYLTMWDIGCFIGPFTSSFIVIALGIPVALVTSTILPLIILILNFTLWR